MKAFRTSVNGKVIAISGIEGNCVVNSVGIAHNKFGPLNLEKIILGIHSSEVINKKQINYRWDDENELKVGDKIEIQIIETENADQPKYTE